MGQFLGEIARLLADAVILPLDVMDYATALDTNVRQFDDKYGQILQENGLSFGKIIFSVSFAIIAIIPKLSVVSAKREC